MNTYLNRLDDNWMGLKSVIVYGLGRTGEKLISHLMEFLGLKVVLIIDNNPKVGTREEFLGIKIRALVDVSDEMLKRYKVIVLTGAMAYESIAETLKKRNLCEYKDFCSVEQFVPEYSWKKNRNVVLCQVATSITTVCTLKCKDCCMFTSKIKNHKTYTFYDLQRNVDVFFRCVDKVLCYQIFGGEPFLHKDLSRFVQYLAENYSKKIGHIQIMTNGTVTPEEDVFKILKQYDVFVRISDYTSQVNYSDKLRDFKKLLDKYQVKYSLLQEMQWSDLGFPNHLKVWGESDTDLHNHMISCSRNCQQLNDERYYFCGVLWGAVNGELYLQEEDEYIELNDIDVTDDNQRKVILEYSLGNIPGKGYLGLCKICNGFGNDNDAVVDAGVQA